MEKGIAFSIIVFLLIMFIGILLTYLIEAFVSPTESTPDRLLDEIFKKIKLKNSDKFIDLGSGTGAVLVEAAKFCNNVNGYELSMILGLISIVRIIIYKFSHKTKTKFNVEVDSFIDQKLEEYNVMYCNLPQVALDHFESNANKLLKTGCRIFTFENSFKQLKPIETYTLSNGKKLYEY